MSKYLVTGGAGYIGGACVEKMIDRGDEVVVLDNLSTGHLENVNSKAKFIKGSVGDKDLLDKLFTDHQIDAVLHFAGFIQVGESVKFPGKYFENNLAQGINLLESMAKSGVNKIIFSSTAAVFGNPKEIPIKEEAEKEPINPYGESKLMLEKVIKRFHDAYGIRFTIFRYFNACGATKNSIENHSPESHLIPIVFESITGKRNFLTINGSDYKTPDGTCVRDYVHISDLVDAHLLAIDYMNDHEENYFNLGSGNGYSIKQVVDSVERVTGRKVPVVMGARREGDPDFLIAGSEKAHKELGWSPKFRDLDSIIKTVWEAVQN